MSWFPDSHKHEGVILERRQVVLLSLAALGALGLSSPATARAARWLHRHRLAWHEFIELTAPLGTDLMQAENPDEEAYLGKISSLLERVTGIPERPALADRIRLDVMPITLHQSLPVVIMQFRMLPGAAIPYHDHRDYNGALMVTAGKAHVRSFEIVGKDKRPPEGSTFRIRETHRVVLDPGKVATLSRTRDNIHDVHAGTDGAELLDFFTFFKPEGKSVYLDVEERGTNPPNGTYDARWKL